MKKNLGLDCFRLRKKPFNKSRKAFSLLLEMLIKQACLPSLQNFTLNNNLMMALQDNFDVVI